ncbi:MAG: polyphenol oxidase family protein, partial [Candidatus Subteraquimicrobiales bacterium]|nr:polyphenol oxidase family protein [Candidatus Subteraquimicrobiales bacterium]
MHNISFQKKGSLGFYTSFKLLKELSVFFAFTTRFGGISPSPYDSLNLAFHVGDNPTNVVKNREILCSTFGLDLSLVTAPEQIHSDGVKIVDSSLKGRGAYSANTAIDGADALITDLKRVPLVIFLADCVPVVLVERHAKAVGIVHAGWQGTYKEIALKTAKLMKETYNLS